MGTKLKFVVFSNFCVVIFPSWLMSATDLTSLYRVGKEYIKMAPRDQQESVLTHD
jgi:hypothetical protein